MDAETEDLARFLDGAVAARDFPHREHVRMAYAVLRRYEFTEAALRYAKALRAITGRAGRPEAFNLTVTIAFLALIAERMAAGTAADFGAFAGENADLFAKDVLARWYRAEQLASPLARRVFLMPDPVA
jgi:hypothetical protein